MVPWKRFGEQVNCLIYSLAGQKYQGDIDLTNRKVAEQIFYSEASLRAMRQGRFRPREDRALVTLVEIGCRQAGLNSTWAEALLRSGNHPDPQSILRMIGNNEAPASSPAVQPVLLPASTWVIPRLVWMGICSLLCLIGWAYGISPQYPAPHELTLLYEVIWAGLAGCGLSGGLLLSQWLGAGKQDLPDIIRISWTVGLIPVGGILGAVIWNTLVSPFFVSTQNPQLQSGALETFIYGLTYSFWFSLPYFLLTSLVRKQIFPPLLVILWLLFTLLCGFLIMGGYVLACLQPAFANQKDIDLLIGLMLRMGLVLGFAFLAPVENMHKQFLKPVWWQPKPAAKYGASVKKAFGE